jgi:hypothetical protein
MSCFFKEKDITYYLVMKKMYVDEFPGIKNPLKRLYFKYPEGGEINATIIKEVRKKKQVQFQENIVL